MYYKLEVNNCSMKYFINFTIEFIDIIFLKLIYLEKCWTLYVYVMTNIQAVININIIQTDLILVNTRWAPIILKNYKCTITQIWQWYRWLWLCLPKWGRFPDIIFVIWVDIAYVMVKWASLIFNLYHFMILSDSYVISNSIRC